MKEDMRERRSMTSGGRGGLIVQKRLNSFRSCRMGVVRKRGRERWGRGGIRATDSVALPEGVRPGSFFDC